MLSPPGSGNKASIAFALSGFVGCITKIGNVDFELGAEEVNCLDTDAFAESVMNDLATMSDTELEWLFDTRAVMLLDVGGTVASPMVALGQPELITITSQTRKGEVTPAMFAAWGCFMKIGLPEHVNNQTQRQAGTIKWTNRDASGVAVKPVWTPAAIV